MKTKYEWELRSMVSNNQSKIENRIVTTSLAFSLSWTWKASQPSMKKSISRPVTFQRRRSTAALTRFAVLKLCAGNMLPDSGAFVFRALAFLFFISAGVFFWFVLFRSAHYSLYLPFPFPLPVPRAAPSSFNNNNWPATFGLILPSDPSEVGNSPPVSSVFACR